jgi:ATP phosphoribosyltransferase
MSVERLHDLRLATSYPGLVESYLGDLGVSLRLIALDGAVETAIGSELPTSSPMWWRLARRSGQLGWSCSAIPILDSEAILICRAGCRATIRP